MRKSNTLLKLVSKHLINLLPSIIFNRKIFRYLSFGLCLLLLVNLELSGQVNNKLKKKNWKPDWYLYFGPSLVNYQIISTEDQASWTNIVKPINTPQFDFGYQLGLDISIQLNQRWTTGLGLRLQFKGGKNGYANIDFKNSNLAIDDQFYSLLMARLEYKIASFISLYNGITAGYGSNRIFESDFEIALISGLKFHLSKRWDSALYYNQGIKTYNVYYTNRQRRFYSFDLSFYFRLNN